MGYFTCDNHGIYVGFALSFNLHHIGMLGIKTHSDYDVDVLFIVFGIGLMMPMPSTKTFHHGILHK